MKLAVSTYSLSQWRAASGASLEDCLDWLADDAGVPGVEFAGLDEKATANPVKRAGELRAYAEKKGLTVAGYCVGAELIGPAKAVKETIDRVKGDVDVAAAFGVKSMRHDVTRGFDAYKAYKGPTTVAAAIKLVAPAIREIADYAQERGVITTLENHGFYMQAPDRVEKLLNTVNHPNFRLTIDMGNFLCVDADPVAAVEQMAKYAVMAHVKDFHVKPKKQAPPSGWFHTPKSIALRGAIVGHGAIDVPKQLKLLKKSGYDGWLSLEFEGMEEPRFAVKTGLDFLRSHLS